MWKKLMLGVIGIIVFFLAVWSVIRVIDSKKEEKQNLLIEDNLNVTNISEEEVTDDCINEWRDYNEITGKEIKNTDNPLGEENTRYIIKNENDYVTIYVVQENGEEVLYKKTSIYSKFLCEEDLELLDKGIEIIGKEELNKIIEDFE